MVLKPQRRAFCARASVNHVGCLGPLLLAALHWVELRGAAFQFLNLFLKFSAKFLHLFIRVAGHRSHYSMRGFLIRLHFLIIVGANLNVFDILPLIVLLKFRLYQLVYFRVVLLLFFLNEIIVVNFFFVSFFVIFKRCLYIRWIFVNFINLFFYRDIFLIIVLLKRLTLIRLIIIGEKLFLFTCFHL